MRFETSSVHIYSENRTSISFHTARLTFVEPLGMAVLQFLVLLTLFYLVVSERYTNKGLINKESVRISARSPRKTNRNFRQPTPAATKPPQNNDFHLLDEAHSSKTVSSPFLLQQKVNSLLRLKQVSGTSIVAVMFLALALRNGMLLEYLGIEELPAGFRLPMKATTSFLVVANVLSAAALFKQPVKMKVFGKATLVLNVLGEALAIVSDVVAMIHMYLLKKHPEVQVAFGKFLGHVFWAMTLLSVCHSRWISPTPRRTAVSPGSQGPVQPPYTPNNNIPAPEQRFHHAKR